MGNIDVFRFAPYLDPDVIRSRGLLFGASSICSVPRRPSPVFRRADTSGSRAFQPQRAVGTCPAGDLDLAATDAVIATRAIALIVERLPLSLGIELA